ncbi:MAG: stage II sporulation protein P, partial [Firmicutes bacterium]|nr:stage II sporulation protein P [Bacillota bacterium]
ARLASAAPLQDYTPASYDISQLTDIPKMMRYIYAVDKKTIMTNDLFDINTLLSIDCKIPRQSEKPLVLIFHTHANELYADSTGKAEGVCGAGEYLKQLLEEKYGIKVLHITEDFDMQDGKLQRNGAYERCEPYIEKVLKENPSVKMCIDLHRDGVSENLRLVKNINGKNYAKIMFFNGLCQKNVDGKAIGVGLENPYLKQNLALSLKMQLALDKKYPGVSRKIYLNAYRYSLHFMDKSMLIELGAQTNTVEEVKNSIEILAELIGEVVL